MYFSKKVLLLPTAAITYCQVKEQHFVRFHCLKDNLWHFYDDQKEYFQPGHGEMPATEELLTEVLSSDCKVGHLLLIKVRMVLPISFSSNYQKIYEN